MNPEDRAKSGDHIEADIGDDASHVNVGKDIISVVVDDKITVEDSAVIFYAQPTTAVSKDISQTNIRGLIPSLAKIFTTRDKKGGSPVLEQWAEKTKEATIVDMFISKRTESRVKAYKWLLGAIAVYVTLSFVISNFLNFVVLGVLGLLLLLTYVNQHLFAYRIRKGFYGTNENEVREIIQFVLDHSDETDFTNGDGRKKLMPDPEVEEQRIVLGREVPV